MLSTLLAFGSSHPGLLQPLYDALHHLTPYTTVLYARSQHALTHLPPHWQTRFGAFSGKATRLILKTIPTEQWYIVGVGLVGGVLLTMLLLSMIAKNKASRSEVLSWTVLWLSLCTIIHCWIELHFVFYRSTSRIANALDLYSAGDFRYGRPLEAGTAAMEGITALVTGPLALATAIAIVRDAPVRHVLQITVSTCQMYGLAWFIAHPLFALSESLATDPFLFWGIAFALNAPWGIFPPILWYKSMTAVSAAFTTHIPKKLKSSTLIDS